MNDESRELDRMHIYVDLEANQIDLDLLSLHISTLSITNVINSS